MGDGLELPQLPEGAVPLGQDSAQERDGLEFSEAAFSYSPGELIHTAQESASEEKPAEKPAKLEPHDPLEPPEHIHTAQASASEEKPADKPTKLEPHDPLEPPE